MAFHSPKGRYFEVKVSLIRQLRVFQYVLFSQKFYILWLISFAHLKVWVLLSRPLMSTLNPLLSDLSSLLTDFWITRFRYCMIIAWCIIAVLVLTYPSLHQNVRFDKSVRHKKASRPGRSLISALTLTLHFSSEDLSFIQFWVGHNAPSHVVF